ncbi:hypothetical protein ACFZBU_06890 [Embleya sp. NPDC008237]|uniref:hypothetical protein n=1 Tax=Embleya sp. NPDC008237 TaxID=3363978 RepID=UPI0036EFAAC6
MVGGTVAAANGAPAPADTSVTTSTAAEVTYPNPNPNLYTTKAACEKAGRNPGYPDWVCRKNTTSSYWQLWVDPDR